MSMDKKTDKKITKTIKTNFRSEIDQCFHDFDQNRSVFPNSRLLEIEKHKIIADKRDKS